MRDINTRQLAAGAERKSNKVTSISSSSTNDQYPSAKAVYDAMPQPQTFYQHVTTLSGTNVRIDARIINKSSVQFTIDTIEAYVKEKKNVLATGVYQTFPVTNIGTGMSSSAVYISHIENGVEIASSYAWSDLRVIYDRVYELN